MEKARRDHYQETARFFGPRFERSGPPGIEIALICVYLDEQGRLVISAEFDESELGQGEMDETPVVVKMSGDTVWSAP